MIENQPNELTLIYHSDKGDDKKARAFIEAITDYVIKTVDLKVQPLTETQLAELANKMNVSIEMLLDATYMDSLHPKNITNPSGVSSTDLLTLLAKEPFLIKTPITVIGKQAYQYRSANELLSSTTVQMKAHQREF